MRTRVGLLIGFVLLLVSASPALAKPYLPCAVAPSVLSFGDSAVVTASGFKANHAVTAYFYGNDSYQEIAATASASGTVSVAFVSASAATGRDVEIFIDESRAPHGIAHCGYLVG